MLYLQECPNCDRILHQDCRHRISVDGPHSSPKGAPDFAHSGHKVLGVSGGPHPAQVIERLDKGHRPHRDFTAASETQECIREVLELAILHSDYGHAVAIRRRQGGREALI